MGGHVNLMVFVATAIWFYSCPGANGCLIKPPLKSVHDSLHPPQQRMWLLIHVQCSSQNGPRRYVSKLSQHLAGSYLELKSLRNLHTRMFLFVVSCLITRRMFNKIIKEYMLQNDSKLPPKSVAWIRFSHTGDTVDKILDMVLIFGSRH